MQDGVQCYERASVLQEWPADRQGRGRHVTRGEVGREAGEGDRSQVTKGLIFCAKERGFPVQWYMLRTAF